MNTGAKQSAESGIEIRHCHEQSEFERCVELQREVWGGGDLEQVPSTIFVVADETGGQVLGAYDGQAGWRMVGFTLAMAGMHGERRYLHSHMTAVVPEYQNRGIGRMLKLFQREDALRRGIEQVEWTFDPLEIRNAYFNIVRLGAIVRRYIPNAYGVTSSPLHGGLPTDRLMAEWWLDSPRVAEAAQRGSVQTYLPDSGSSMRIIVPRELPSWKVNNREMAAEEQQRIGGEFQRYLERGYAACGFELSDAGDSYLLTPFADVPGMKP
jgi:predicted GNAT superfamily acetyltransferase